MNQGILDICHGDHCGSDYREWISLSKKSRHLGRVGEEGLDAPTKDLVYFCTLKISWWGPGGLQE